jgi:hypothetical protein
MRDRLVSWGLVTLAALVASCGGPESAIVERYFRSVKQQDMQTLSSFATVTFDKPVQSWKVIGSEPDEKAPATLADLAAKKAQLDEQLAENIKQAKAYNLEHFQEWAQVQEIEKKGGKIPAKLAGPAAKWHEFNDKNRDLKKALAEAADAVEHEKRHVAMSLTAPPDNIESLTGDVLTKRVNIEVTSGGEARPYLMTLRRYDLSDGPRKVMSRWIVTGLEPK